MRSLRLIIKITLIHPHSDQSHHRVPWQQPLVTRIIFWALKIPSSFYWLILSVPIPDPRGARLLPCRTMDDKSCNSVIHSLTRVQEWIFQRFVFYPLVDFPLYNPTLQWTHTLVRPPTTRTSLREYKWFINQSLFRSGATTYTYRREAKERPNERSNPL